MVKILFVCHGNICRSPMAEFVFRDMVRNAGREGEFEIASAAVSSEELGNPVYPPARRELASHGISCEGKRARRMVEADCRYYDYIYYMDRANARRLHAQFPQETKFQPFLPGRDVADPWYTGDFSQTWADVQEGCSRILKELMV